MRRKLKPCLLLSNHCHVEYFDLALSLTELLANQAASVVRRS